MIRPFPRAMRPMTDAGRLASRWAEAYAQRRGDLLLPGIVLLLYAAVIGVLVVLRTVPYTGYESDGVEFMLDVRNLFGAGFNPPTHGAQIGMVLAMAVVRPLVGGDTFAAAKLVSALAGLLFLLASMRVIQRLFSPATAWMTGLLMLVCPVVLIYSTTSMADVLSTALVMLGIWAIVGGNGRWNLFLAGLAMGLAWTTRFLDFTFWPLLLVPFFAPGLTKRKAAVIVALEAAGLILGMLPQLVTNAVYHGNPLYTNNWQVTAALVYNSWDKAFALHSFWPVLAHHWKTLASLWIKRFTIDMFDSLYHTVFWAAWLAVPGMFIAVRRSPRRIPMALWTASVVLYLFLLAPVWRIEFRYLLPVVPFVLACAVAMWRVLVDDKKLAVGVGLALAVLVSSAAAAQETGAKLGTQAPELKQLGTVVGRLSKPNDVVMSGDRIVYFYANRSGLMFKELLPGERHQLLRAIPNHRIAWVAFDSHVDGPNYPSYAWMGDPHSARAARLGWHLAYYQASPAMVVWRTGQ